ncbi:MAG TPA: MarP family serine protease [Patescibacteria group bacterium]|nr:MarP family serine protease [Patescibacteria group bacterium]
MNFVDVLIILLLIGAIFRGMNSGLLRLMLSSVGFIIGLVLGFWIAKFTARYISGDTLRALYIVSLELILALSFSTLGEFVGIRLSMLAKRFHLDRANRLLGSVFEVVFILLAVWIIASGLSNIQTANVGKSIQGSWIIRRLDAALPAPPDFIAQLEKIVDPNGFPKVFIGNEPHHTTIAANPAVDSAVVAKAEKSVVKVEGTGCGGVVEGSGFVTADGIVVTNAHVIAGVSRPMVVDSTASYRAIPIWFDENEDLAVLMVKGLKDPPLAMSSDRLGNGASAVVLGFPGGGELTASKATVIDQVKAIGRNIYNRGVVVRNIYELQADVEPGNSGGPLIASDGSVAGVVFAKAVSQSNVGYSLQTGEVKAAIDQAQQQLTPVAVGSCAAD